MLQRSLGMAKHDNQIMRETMSTDQQKMVAAEKEADEIRTKAHSDARASASRIKTLQVIISLPPPSSSIAINCAAVTYECCHFSIKTLGYEFSCIKARTSP
jgi:hypothetical protein